MKKTLVLILILMVFVSCKTVKATLPKKLKLKFLDEYIVPENIMVNETLVGGLSGIDYAKDKYYLVCDDSSSPRYYEAEIKIGKAKFDTIAFTKVVKIKEGTRYLDLESIRYDKNRREIIITSEGSINRKKDPSLFSVSPNGIINHFFEIPNALKATSKQKPRNNGTLEGLAISYDNKGYWIAMELPLGADGPEPKVTATKSPVRITYIDAETKKPTKQFAYYLDKIDKAPKGDFAINGLSDLIQYKKDKFMVIERSYSSGLGTQGNTIKIFDIDASKATNTLSLNNLKDIDFKAAHKELIFDLDSIRNRLTAQFVDNIEGLAFGPALANGNRTLLLVSDNNFNKLGPQLNQFILLEVLNY